MIPIAALSHPLDGAVLSAILDALPGPVIVVDDAMRVAAMNRPVHDILPTLRPGDALPFTLRDPDVLAAARRTLDTGERQNVLWRDRVPLERSYEVSVARLNPPEGGSMLVLSLLDCTETRRIERMRADFIANASHELRTPLASLLGFVETLQGPARDDAVARVKFLDIMAAQGRRMARLVDDLLSLSRIEQMLHLRPSRPVDLVLIARHVADTLSPLAREKKVTLAVASHEPVVVTGERDELVRVAENLIENAIKYGCLETRDGAIALSRVDVTVARGARDGILTVRDHGPGIPRLHLPRLTERFYRVDVGHSRAQGGTGLGLALVKHILARHRGHLSIDSVEGRGSTFVATVPLLDPKRPEPSLPLL